MLQDHCPVCLSVLSLCNVGVLWPNDRDDCCILMLLGTEVGLGPGNNVLDGDPAAPTERDTAASPHFLAHVYCDQTVAHLSSC